MLDELTIRLSVFCLLIVDLVKSILALVPVREEAAVFLSVATSSKGLSCTGVGFFLGSFLLRIGIIDLSALPPRNDFKKMVASEGLSSSFL